MEFSGRARATIDLAALKSNFLLARSRLAPQSQMVGVIKANAYGHGLHPVAHALESAELFGVTDLQEAVSLSASTEKPILILQGLIADSDIDAVGEMGLQLVVHCVDQLRLIDEHLSRQPPKSPLVFWLKMDSGMGRLGISPEDYTACYRQLADQSYTQQVVAMTHLANASLPGDELTSQQLKVFTGVCETLGESITSISSSSGILATDTIQSNWSRPGIMLYGSSPFPWEHESLRGDALGLKPVMTLEAKIIAVKQLQAGDNIGYCSQFICPRPMTVGIVSIGYADGYPSNAPNTTPVLVKGKRTGTVGRVSMDMLAIDLTQLPQAGIGDTVTLWGRGLPADEVAAKTGILSYNLFCSITDRVEFTYING